MTASSTSSQHAAAPAKIMNTPSAAAPTESSPVELARVCTGSEILWETLIREGVSVMFGYPGGAIMPAYDALPKYPQLHHVLVRHEQGAAHAAEGYARAS